MFTFINSILNVRRYYFYVMGTQIYTRYTQARGAAHPIGHKTAAIRG
jgi:hypothetical protein